MEKVVLPPRFEGRQARQQSHSRARYACVVPQQSGHPVPADEADFCSFHCLAQRRQDTARF